MSGFISLVNQKQCFADLLLQQAEAASDHHLRQALLQGVVLQLRLAYRFYLGEIGHTYRCREPETIADLWSLIANLQLQGKNPVETTEIYNLEQREDSWLSQLHQCWQALESVPDSGRASNTDPERIPAFSLSPGEDWSTLDASRLKTWLDAFSELVDRQRQSMMEY